jgi:hypothetical protein
MAHPEINLQVPTASKFPIADLERHRHLVVLVERFVEAFALVGLHLDIVRRRERKQAARRSEEGERWKQHIGGYRNAIPGGRVLMLIFW